MQFTTRTTEHSVRMSHFWARPISGLGDPIGLSDFDLLCFQGPMQAHSLPVPSHFGLP